MANEAVLADADRGQPGLGVNVLAQLLAEQRVEGLVALQAQRVARDLVVVARAHPGQRDAAAGRPDARRLQLDREIEIAQQQPRHHQLAAARRDHLGVRRDAPLVGRKPLPLPAEIQCAIGIERTAALSIQVVKGER